MALDEQAMSFRAQGRSVAIPLRAILAFSVAREDKALISGAKGKIAEAAPYGIGFAVTMSRPAAYSLTLFYKDADGAVHGCVLVLPKDGGERIASSLAPQLSPTDYPKTGELAHPEAQHAPGIQMASESAKPSVEVALPSESIEGVPSAFPAAVYENLIKQLSQSGLFSHVWRAGDIHRASDSLVLRVDIQDWKKGSARGRGLGPFTGATTIKGSVSLEDRSGRAVFQGPVSGAKRTRGENIEAADSLAKHVRKALQKSHAWQAKTPADK